MGAETAPSAEGSPAPQRPGPVPADERPDPVPAPQWPGPAPADERPDPGPVPVPAPGIRASDGEREEVARILRAAAGEGLITLDEADERLAAVYRARFRHELEPLVADLPDGGRHLLQNTTEARAAARAGLLRHGLTVGVVAAVLLVVWVASDTHFFWPAWPLLFMFINVSSHARRVRYRERRRGRYPDRYPDRDRGRYPGHYPPPGGSLRRE